MRIQAAVLAAIAAGRASGGGRACLTGLWLAAVSVLVEAGEPEDVMALLLDRACTLRGHGRNADAPPLQEDDEARGRRGAEAGLAARSIVDALSPLPQIREDDFPERLLDVAVSLLAEAWGPHHVRRALWDQRTGIESGSLDVILPVEPAISNGAARPRPPLRDEPQTSPVAAAAAPEPPPLPARPPRPPSPSTGRRIEIHVDAAQVGPGRCVHALCARIRHGEVSEVRELTGPVAGASLRRAVLQSVEAFLAGLVPGPGEHVRVATPVEGAVRVAEGGDGEDGMADLLASIRDGRSVEWRLGTGTMGTDLGRRCDRALRDRIDEEERSGTA